MFKKGFYGGKFFPFHLGHLYCCITALSQCEELYVVMFHSSKEEKRALWDPELKFNRSLLTPAIREAVIRKELQPFPNVHVITIDCSETDALAAKNETSSWYEESLKVKEKIGDFDVCFSSSPEYSNIFEDLYPDSEHVIIDAKRSLYNMSGTMLRHLTFFEAYDFIPRTYQVFGHKSVLIIGTESCGKTTLTRKLATIFNTSYTDEYGRLVCEEYNTGQPLFNLYDSFLYGQKALEAKARSTANRIYFCDTDAIYTEFFANQYEGRELPLGTEIARNSHYDLVLYLEPSNRWTDDGYRTFGDDDARKEKDEILKAMYLKSGYEVRVLCGTYMENYNTAVELVKNILQGE